MLGAVTVRRAKIVWTTGPVGNDRAIARRPVWSGTEVAWPPPPVCPGALECVQDLRATSVPGIASRDHAPGTVGSVGAKTSDGSRHCHPVRVEGQVVA